MPLERMYDGEERAWFDRERRRGREHDDGLDREAMHDPGSWATLPLCPLCHKPIEARFACSACGDSDDMEAAAA